MINLQPTLPASSLPFYFLFFDRLARDEQGLKYLHESGINHGDLKSRNVLLQGGGAKISDCGLGHVCSAIGLKTGNGAFLAEKVGARTSSSHGYHETLSLLQMPPLTR